MKTSQKVKNVFSVKMSTSIVWHFERLVQFLLGKISFEFFIPYLVSVLSIFSTRFRWTIFFFQEKKKCKFTQNIRQTHVSTINNSYMKKLIKSCIQPCRHSPRGSFCMSESEYCVEAINNTQKRVIGWKNWRKKRWKKLWLSIDGVEKRKKKTRFLIADHERRGLAGFSILLHFDNIFQIVVVKKRNSAWM